MPPIDPNPPKDKTATPNASVNHPVPGDDVLREDWKKLSSEDKNRYFSGLSADEQVKFGQRIGLFGHATGVSAPPATGSIPWMKEKAAQLYTWGANQLPTVGGVTGGLVGGAVGGAATVGAGGEVPGAIAGSGVGGGIGEAARQYLLHKSGYDQYDDPKSKELGNRTLGVAGEFIGQAVGEVAGQGLGKLLRPTLERSLAKLYYAGGIKYGNPLGKGDLETVIDDLIKTEKSGAGKATTVGDFIGVINQAKNDIGQEVDRQMMLPINQNGNIIMLGKARADSTPIVTAINNMATADPSIVKEAALSPAGKEAAYLEHIRREALKFSQQPWTYEELTSKRIRLNNELAAMYEKPKGEQRAYLLDHPDLAVAKAEADAIRDVVYPKMDTLSGKPAGTTAELQGKRGALMSIENQVTDHLSKLKTVARQAKGAPPLEKMNVSTYGTSSGKPGFAVHRLFGFVHTPNPEAKADTQVAKAFVHGVGPTIRKGASTKVGQEVMSIPVRLLAKPLREVFNPSQVDSEDKYSSEGNTTYQDKQIVSPDPTRGVKGVTLPVSVPPSGGQSSVTPGPRELIKKAKDLNSAATGQVAYSHVAVNPATGHKIGSRDGEWFDIQTGAKVA